MKRFITLLLVAVMLVSTLVFSTNAAGTLVFSDNFDDGFVSRNWIQGGCNFSWDKYNQCIHGYSDAYVLQSNFLGKYDKMWGKYYASMDFQVRGFDDLPEQEGRMHGISMWYRDKQDAPDDQYGPAYTFHIEFETGKATLNKEHSWDYYDENGNKQSAETDVVIAEGNINTTIEVGESAPWYEIGMRVTDGKIECYLDQKLILSAEVNPDDPKYGDYTLNSVDTSVGSGRSGILFFNEGNWLALDNFKVWTPDYDFVAVTYGDADSDGSVKLGDASLMLKQIAGWSDLTIDMSAADVNVDGAVNLTDVSTVLKVVAGWKDVVLGPQA